MNTLALIKVARAVRLLGSVLMPGIHRSIARCYVREALGLLVAALDADVEAK